MWLGCINLTVSQTHPGVKQKWGHLALQQLQHLRVRVEVWMERFANGNYLFELASWFQIIPGCVSWCLSHPS